MIGAFESTYMPEHDRDVVETTQHDVRWRDDLDLLWAAGATRCRYPIRWHRIERSPGRFDWSATDRVLEHLRDRGIAPIVDLLHHTSYPRWVTHFGDPAFGPAYLRFVETFAERYPWVHEYTLCNEPFTTFLLCGEVGVWPPYDRGISGFVRIARSVLPWITEASRRLAAHAPETRHVYVDTCEAHTAASTAAAKRAAWANDRRFFVLDLFLGRDLDRSRPFVRSVCEAGGGDLLDVAPGRIDVLGLDYYAHNQWEWMDDVRGSQAPRAPQPLARLVGEYWARYGLPCLLAETNIRGYPTDRVSWFKYTLEQCEQARAWGVDLRGYCWFPTIDSCDWASLLARCEGDVDPVGIYLLDERFDRQRSAMSDAFEKVALGAPAAAVPAYRFQPPVADWVRGWLPQMRHWAWEDPPVTELARIPRIPEDAAVRLEVPRRRA